MSISTTHSRPSSFRGNHRSKPAEDIKGLGNEAGSLLTRAAGQTAEQATALQSRLRDAIKGAKVRVNHAAKAVRRQAARTDKVIRAKPYHSLAVAAGVGLLAGYLFGRRRSNSG
jgi:ElaB/YqjD/DUF883 family membrane-anchored ribosome-binding protein